MAQDNNADQPKDPRSIDERLDLLTNAVSSLSADNRQLQISIGNLRDVVAELYVDMKELRETVSALARSSASQYDSIKLLAMVADKHETRLNRLDPP